ncbi:MAG: hypothetical protein M0Q13_10115 [Methanothrix sp.]|jgi:hypothetical protein|nr:hypothetical protein [Methanothrix sp.]
MENKNFVLVILSGLLSGYAYINLIFIVFFAQYRPFLGCFSKQEKIK